jgi:hypothetical protein
MLPPRRGAVPLDGTWEFIRDPEHRLTGAALPAGERVSVPGPWEADLPDPQGIVHGWYRREFVEPDDWPAGSLTLRFDVAMMRSRVWLDGRLVGEHDGGFFPFELDAGPARPGRTHDLVVAVENPFNSLTEFPTFEPASLEHLPGGKQTWYTSTSGLLGSVSTAVVPAERLTSLSVEPDLEARRVVVRWQVGGSDRPGATQGTRAGLELSLRGPGGNVVAECTVDAGEGRAVIPIDRPEPWDLWQPVLYRLHARLEPRVEPQRDGEPAASDETSIRFGLRSVAIRDGSVLLNGRRLYLRGALDQDFWPVGRSNPPSRAGLERQVALAREMGLNLLRCHLKIPDPMYLDVADEAGLLLWCELPSWHVFDRATGELARRVLAGMVEALGHHPAIIAWTVINEDWGTRLRHSAGDRRWLRQTVDWLMDRDPSRLVVDNSACETADGPNFHLRTDLADFHAYRSMPDGLPRWRAFVADLASRPAWLWSPFGDASPTGQEPLLLSEFGGWGLPRPSGVMAADGRDPWWSSTGLGVRRPAGIRERFRDQGLDRVWPDLDRLADATQWQQFEGLAAQVRELRRHPSIQGYVITELADAFWEPNGLLDVARGPKAFHDRLAEVNAEDVLSVDLPRTDLWAGERLAAEVVLASHRDQASAAGAPPGDGRLEWVVRFPNGAETSGSATIERWPNADAGVVASVEILVPEVGSTMEGELVATATSSDGRRAVHRQRLVAVAGAGRRSSAPRRIAVVDPLGLWSLEARLRSLGHEIEPVAAADLIVTTEADPDLVEAANEGGSLLVIARSADAIPASVGLARPAAVEARRPGDDVGASDMPWDGDWSSVFAWALPGVAPGLPRGGLLHLAHAEVFPDNVITGLDVADPGAGVSIGIFSGWIHAPAALLATFEQGAGRVTITTLRLGPEAGPVATVLLESIVQTAAEVR